MQDLNDLIAPSLWTLKSAVDINDNGQIIGYCVDLSGTQHAFLLTPVPEPATMSLLSVGLGTLVIRKRHKRV